MKRTDPFSRLAGDQRGVSAVEFALVAPLMIFFYFGMAEFCQGFMAQKRTSHVSAITADLVSQEDIVTAANVDDIFEIGGLIMKPFSTTQLRNRVSSVTLGSNGVATVDWVRGDALAGSPLAKGDVVTLPADLLAIGESVIMSEATYDYESPVDYFLDPVTKFSAKYYLRPRTTNQTICTDC